MMNILVAGGNGSVGFDLVNLLAQKSNILSLHRSNVNRKKIKNVKWVRIDLKNKINLNYRPDIVINCIATHEFSKKNKDIDYINSNIISVKNLLDFAQKQNVKKFINLSTMRVYEKKNFKIIDEKQKTIFKSYDLLGVTKSLGEKLIKEQSSNYINLRLPGVLCSNTLGERPWLNLLIKKIINNKTVAVFNPNSLFNNVIDTREIVKFIDQIKDNKKTIKDYFNLSASKPMKIIEVVKTIKNYFSSDSKIMIKKKNKISAIISTCKINKKLKFYPESTQSIILRNLENY